LQPTILIIDDGEDDVLLMKIVLSRIRRDLKTEVALSGEAGLALLRRGEASPQLILLDLKMPNMSGIEVLQKIRGDAGLRGIPVVMITNSTLESDKMAAVEAGADSFLHKATDLDQFRKDMERILARWLDTKASHP
jgi:CheY-like chemotaxis protein